MVTAEMVARCGPKTILAEKELPFMPSHQLDKNFIAIIQLPGVLYIYVI
jgi:hypothetical protein